jgi:hypothetical protein
VSLQLRLDVFESFYMLYAEIEGLEQRTKSSLCMYVFIEEFTIFYSLCMYVLIRNILSSQFSFFYFVILSSRSPLSFFLSHTLPLGYKSSTPSIKSLDLRSKSNPTVIKRHQTSFSYAYNTTSVGGAGET